MPHDNLTRVGARALIRAKHVNQIIDALENTPTLDDLPAAFNYMPMVDTVGELPAVDNDDGDLRVVAANDHAYLWDDGAWHDLGPVTMGEKGDPGTDGADGQGSVYLPNALGAAGGGLLGDGQITFTTFGADGLPIPAAVSLLVEAFDRDEVELGGGAVDSVNGETGAVVLDAADVGAAPGLPINLSTAWGDQRPYPRLTKPLSAPILTFGMQSAASVYLPNLVDRRPMGGTGVSLIYSTDHGTTGGIYGLHADSPLGTWTDDGLLYVDSTEGDQTETPVVIWNETTDLYHVYYQQNGSAADPWTGLGEQSTFLATTPDLETFTRVGRVLDVVSQTEAGDGHTGYFRPFRVGDAWYGFSLYGGQDQPRWAQWQSLDGLTWYQHPHRMGHHTPLIAHIPDVTTSNRLTIGGSVLQWRGRWWAFSLSSFGSGGGIRTGVVMASPLADNLREFAGRPIELPLDAQAWEDDGINQLGAPIEWNGKMYLTYRAGEDASANVGIGLLEVV